MKLEYYREIHPNWNRIANLSESEAEATLDLLVTAVFVDRELSEEELETLGEEWAKLPFDEEIGPEVDLRKQLYGTHSYLRKILDEPELFYNFLKVTCDKIKDEETQIAVFRMVAMTVVSDGVDELEFDLCYAIGSEFELNYDTVEQLLDSVWESHQKASHLLEGEDHHVPSIKGSDWARQRAQNQEYANPFSMRET
jgi:hypothetical protein